MTTKPPNLPPNNENDPRYAPPGMRPPQPEAMTPTPSATPEAPAQRALWGCGGALGCVGILAAGVLIFAVITAGTMAGGLQLLNNLTSNLFQPPSATVTSSQTIVTRIQPLGQLVSTSAQVAKADIEVSIAQGAFSVCDHRANHVASATIEAGIDLYQIEPEAVTYNAEINRYTVRVPLPVITRCSVEFIDQYERQVFGPTCRVDWDDARQIAQYEALIAFRDEAVEGGLLITAERDAQQALTSFIGAITGSEVIIEFVEVPGVDRAAACMPQPPRDWQQDTETGAWIRGQ